ncbi:MAG: hypothetical protein IJX62_08555, partial [Clostridia bacterium]|nr:hypothetical protein [Clostridia bacterium]
MSKNLLEIFHRYTPDGETAALLLSADPDSIVLRADKQQRVIEADVAFPNVIPKLTLYRIEEEIRKAYQLNAVRLCPTYPSRHFGVDRIPDLLMETNRRGIVANGFFHHGDYRVSETAITVEIPFSDGGVGLVCDARTPQLMEELIKKEFGVSIRVEIRRMQDYDPTAYESSVKAQIRELEREAARAEVQYQQMQQAQFQPEEAPAVEGKEILPRAASIYEGPVVPDISEGTCRIGHSVFDISSPEYVYGDPFEIRPMPIAAIDKAQRNIVILGEIFGFAREESRTADKFDITFDIFDGNTSIEHR